MMDAETRARKHHHQRELSAIKKAERREHLASRPAKVATGGGKLSGEALAGTKRGHISFANMAKLRDAQRGRCATCRAKISPTTMEEIGKVGFHVDHRVPLALGGDDRLSNWQLLCIPCHLAKTKLDVSRIAKAKRQSKLLQPREPSKHPIRSRGFS